MTSERQPGRVHFVTGIDQHRLSINRVNNETLSKQMKEISCCIVNNGDNLVFACNAQFRPALRNVKRGEFHNLNRVL
jgi:hypothetical protein